MLHRTAEGLEHQLPRHPSFFDNSSRTKFFAPLPEHFHGSFVAISPLNGRLSELDKLWSILTMDPEFETATIVFSGNYLCGPHARHLLSLLCTLRLAHPSPIFLSGPNDLAAAAYLGLLKNLELSVALNAVGTTWAEENHEVFASYGVTSRTATDLLTAMPPEHREFLTELAVSVKHDDVTLTAMPATTLAASSLTSEFASDFFTLPHPELHPPTSSALSNIRDSTQATSSPSAARSSGAAAADSGDVESDERHQRTHSGGSGGSGTGGAQTGQMEIQPQVDARMTEATPKTMYVDPIAEFPGINADGLALNGSGLLAALFYPSGRVVVASLDGPRH